MPWVAPIVGYSDNLGRLRCSECAEDDQRAHAYAGDGSFGDDDVCESCGWRFVHIRTKDYVQVAWGYPTPDFKKPVIDAPVKLPIEPTSSCIPARGKQTFSWALNSRRHAGYGFGS